MYYTIFYVKRQAFYVNCLKILDTYSLEFLDLPNEFSEKDFKNAIIKNLKDFILEVQVKENYN